MQFVTVEIKQIQVSDLELAACRRAQRAAKIDDALVVNVKARHGEVTFWLFWFLFQTDSFAFRIELHNAITLRVANLIAKNARAAIDGERIAVEVQFPIENVVTKDKRCARVADKFRAD